MRKEGEKRSHGNGYRVKTSHILVSRCDFQKHRFYDGIISPNNVNVFVGQRVTSVSGENVASGVANV